MESYELTVEGMSCTGCEETVTTAVRRVPGVHRVEADHETDSVEVTAEDGAGDAIRDAIHGAGFDMPA